MALMSGQDQGLYVQMTSQEQALLSLIDDVNENLQRSFQKSSSQMNQGIQIPFLNVNEMSGPTQALYLMLIFGSVFAGLYKFYDILVLAPEREEEAKRAKREALKQKKGRKSL